MLDGNLHGRRRFLQNAALFSTGLVTSLASTRLARANDETIEAVVIGSGFGGAVAALRLGQAGIKTLIIERGRRWSIIDSTTNSTFATFRQPDRRAAWLSPMTWEGIPTGEIYTGVLETKHENGISVLCGAGVGGGSLVYNGITYQPTRELFYKVFPKEIDYNEMDSVYYPRARSIIKAAPIPQDILATDYYLATRAFLQEAANAELRGSLLDIAVDWDIVRQEINGTKVPSTILGEHWYGINSGAKNSLDRSYLAQAENTGNVEILPLHIVTEISEVTGYGYKIKCSQINESGETIATKTITCKHLFLAAGSMGTSALLVKAKATGTLRRLNDYIGLDWGSNGDTSVIRSGIPLTTSIQGIGQGGPASAVIEYFDNPLNPISIQFYSRWNAPQGILISLCMGIPSVKGRFNYDSTTGSVKLTWPGNKRSGDPDIQRALEFAYRLIDRKNSISTGKTKTEIIPGSYPLRKNTVTEDISDTLTAHPLGGAVLGKACDLYGRVVGYRGLYVVDGALIPGSAGSTNPSLTVAALAERCMERILAEDIAALR